ncbi:hypothetical protein QJS83_04990 [Bdellovibrio sp. 22V]|uniref:hypothetical protein n=1 Tax=Bdellovibrio sp. 22V TaxID=3044166 RepID=UPI002543E92E|nr:hypothetical protein [Bdellovibrio sp. 22V]WII73227.1 hypothetical protein QJS83_04990 [Bdellovibrio sp. 22V]
MRKWTVVAIVGASLILQLGCKSKGFHRQELTNALGVTKPEFDDAAIKAAFKKKPNLPKPFKLAVFFKTPKNFQGGLASWHWQEKDKALFTDMAPSFNGAVSEIFPIVNSVVESEDLKSLRLAAAQHGADALLVVSGTGEIDRYINKWGWSYILLLPAFFVPGSESDTLFLANAVIYDVKNEFLYFTVESEAQTNDRYIAAFHPSDKELFNKAKSQALQKLQAEMQQMLLQKKQ